MTVGALGVFPSAEECVLRPLLERRAHEQPDQVFAVFEAGERWTYADALRSARSAAESLWQLGVREGDRVASWLSNGPDAVRIWFGSNLLGAIYVPLNTDYRGTMLERVLNDSKARLVVTESRLLERLEGLSLDHLEAAVVVEGSAGGLGSIAVHGPEVLEPGAGEPAAVLASPEPWDDQSILYTSGTTGASKGVLSSYMHLYTNCIAGFGGLLDHQDRYMVHLPLFHIGGVMGVYGMLVLGASASIISKFSTTSFWTTATDTGSTASSLLGVMATFLWKQPPRPEDAAHSLRFIYMTPLIEESERFAERFGVVLHTMYNSTELSVPLRSGPNPAMAGVCGTVREGIEVRVVDEHDREVPVGKVGELIVRAALPWTMMHGYDGRPEDTAAAWRNGWFHTGDAMYRDEAGNHFFVDRMQDTIRRRGENVSSFEVESEVCTYPGVREAVAIAVPSEVGDQDVMVVVAPVDGQEIEPRALLEHLVGRMPYFMVPRYIRVVPELPKTTTSKVLKTDLRRLGVTGDTWDREAERIFLHRGQ